MEIRNNEFNKNKDIFTTKRIDGIKPTKFEKGYVLSSFKNKNKTDNFIKNKNDFGKNLDKTIKLLMYLIVFFLPLFFLPYSTEMFEFNKTLLLFILVTSAFLIWISKMILLDRKIIIVKTILDVPILAFIFITVLSTIFSIDKISSIIGFYGRFSESLVVVICIAMFYFLGVNYGTKNNNEFANNLIKTFLLSSLLIILTSVASLLGVKFLPWNNVQTLSFSLIGKSFNLLGIYLVPVIIILIGKFAIEKEANKFQRIIIVTAVGLSLLILVIADSIFIWTTLLISLLIVLILISANRIFTDKNKYKSVGLLKKEKCKNSMLFPTIVILISIVFIISGFAGFGKNNDQEGFYKSPISDFVKKNIENKTNEKFQEEFALDKNTAIKIAFKNLDERFLLGYGPATYYYSFSMFRPAEFNNGNFWNLRFHKAGSEILEKISTIGILGVLSYLSIAFFLIVAVFETVFRNYNKKYKGDKSNAQISNFQHKNTTAKNSVSMLIYIFAAWVGLLTSQFFYIESISARLAFWIFTIIIVSYCCLKKEIIEKRFIIVDLNKSKDKSFFSIIILILIFSSTAILQYFSLSFYKAEKNFTDAVLIGNKTIWEKIAAREKIALLEQSGKIMELSVKQNPYIGKYESYLSEIYLSKAKLRSSIINDKTSKSEVEFQNKNIENEIKKSIEHAKKAVALNPNNVNLRYKSCLVYVVLAKDFEIKGADEFAVSCYKKAIELEKNNPFLHAELGEIYKFQAYNKHNNSLSKEDAKNKIELSIEEFEKAIELKNDYTRAGLQLGLIYETKKDNKKAIDKIESTGVLKRIKNAKTYDQIENLVKNKFVDIDAAFQLGRIYYNIGKKEKAKKIFLDIIRIQPANSNARFSLGLIFEDEGKKEKALEQFKILLSLNPNNKKIISKIKEIEKKQPKLETRSKKKGEYKKDE